MNNPINEYIKIIESSARKDSIKNLKGEESYAYMLGYFQSTMEHLLEDLNLTKKQVKLIENKIKKELDHNQTL